MYVQNCPRLPKKHQSQSVNNNNCLFSAVGETLKFVSHLSQLVVNHKMFVDVGDVCKYSLPVGSFCCNQVI